MRPHSALFFLCAALALHLILQVPLLIAAALAGIFWIIWKIKYVLLAIVGIEWIIDREG